MTKQSILKELIRIHKKYSRERYSNESSQTCTIWPVDDPPGVLEGTEPLEEICDFIGRDIEDDFAICIYDMTLDEAAESLCEFCNNDEK
jgi:hypothetical protein